MITAGGEFVTENGARVIVFNETGDEYRKAGIYLYLRMAAADDLRSGELRLTSDEARKLAGALEGVL